MQDLWITSPTGRRVVAFAGDSRPAWLWSADGESLTWHNDAARRYAVRASKRAHRGAVMAVPIRGQIARLVRLGTPDRSSLARIQFLIGDKPVSGTCTCTPLTLPDGEAGLFIVGVDPVEGEANENWGQLVNLLPQGLGFAVRGEDGTNLAGLGTEGTALETFALGTPGLTLTLFDGPGGDAPLATEKPVQRVTPPPPEPEPTLPMDLPAVASDPPKAPAGDAWAEIEPVPQRDESLGSLFDRLAGDSALFDAIEDADEAINMAPLAPIAEPKPEWVAQEAPEQSEPTAAVAAAEAPALYRVTARSIAAVQLDLPEQPTEPALHEHASATTDVTQPVPEAAPFEQIDPRRMTEAVEAARDEALSDAEAADTDSAGIDAPSPEVVERVSRYNFDELSRILTDRVGQDPAPPRESGRNLRLVASGQGATGDGALVSLGSETLVLNRLPLGILVFRDQQVLFANRAITDMIGYENVESLRRAGLAAIFPAAGEEPQAAGPVNHLVQRDGTLVPVTARLQSIAWQGKPALMLSASATEVRTGHEAAVRAFAEMLAEQRGDGFVEATRNGVISGVSAAAIRMIGRPAEQIVGKPLLALVADAEDLALKAFLERPARFAETARPVLTATSSLPDTDLQLYAQGQAGIVAGYFGFLHRKSGASLPALPPSGEIDPALLGRLSRGLRRPLNTIVGFSELIRSGAFGAVESPRTTEYARDILGAGQEIAALVDELDDYARLKDGRYTPRTAEIDLMALLESCVVRIRGQAGAGRVLVRSAISETLPHVRADRASLGQAVLNLLSSAIDQSPAGGAVVLSAHLEDDGSVLVHVREQGAVRGDLGESFVIFRDGTASDGKALAPVRSSVGLALTRSLLEINSASLSVEAAGTEGTIFSLRLPPDSVIRA